MDNYVSLGLSVREGLGYRVFRVYNGFLRGNRLHYVLVNVDRLILYYSLDGYVYIYLIPRIDSSSGFRHAIYTLYEDLTLSHVDEIDILGSYEPVNIPYDLLKDGYLVRETDLGYILVLKSLVDSSYADRNLVRYGLYRFIPGSLESLDPYSLDAFSTIYIEDMPTLVNTFLRYTTHLGASEYDTPLKIRKDYIHLDGSTQYLRGFKIKLPDVSIDIPLDHHIFLLGESRSGKSVGIADIIDYIMRYTDSHVIVFDWVGNFISLTKSIDDSIVIRPGEDLHIDIYRVFEKKVLPEIYEEASLLYFRGSRNASFTPATYEKLVEAISNADNHLNLIKVLMDMRSRVRDRDDKSAISALLRRIKSLDPSLYISMDGEPSLIDLIMGNRLVLIDLSAIPSEMDKILFTLICLKVLYLNWDSRRPRLYIVIDEAHRMAPRSEDNREWLLNRIAREGLKYNLNLILADQTLMNISEDIWGNMGHKFIFTLDNPRDIDRVSEYLLPLLDKLGLPKDKVNIIKLLRLKPGECILIMKGVKEPVECYFRYYRLTETGSIRKIDNDRLWKILIETGFKEDNINTLKTLSKAKKIIRKYEVNGMLQSIKRFLRNKDMKTLELDGIVLMIREGGRIRMRKALEIYLKYHSIPVEKLWNIRS